MADLAWPELEEHFRVWSGGSPPDSICEITVYVDYANKFGNKELVRDYLLDWMSAQNWPDPPTRD